MDPTLNPADLLTIAGASVAAIVVTQFAKILFTLTRRKVRIVALVTGLTVVVGAYVTLNPASVIGVFLAVIVGMQAGMAANATFDTVRGGIDYQAVTPRSPAVLEGMAEDG